MVFNSSLLTLCGSSQSCLSQGASNSKLSPAQVTHGFERGMYTNEAKAARSPLVLPPLSDGESLKEKSGSQEAYSQAGDPEFCPPMPTASTLFVKCLLLRFTHTSE